MGNEIYKILYVENNAEKVTQLRQLIRANSVDSKITFDVMTTDSIETIHLAVSKDQCDLVILQDSPKVPILKEVNDAVGMKETPVLVLVNEDQFLEKRSVMINDGAVDVGVLQQGDVLFKQIVRAIFEFKTQIGYRDTLEKNAKLTEITAQLAATSEDLIAYFGAEDGIFLYANEAFLTYFGHQNFDDLAATTVLEYITAEQSAQFKKMMKIVGRTGKEQVEALTLKQANGVESTEKVELKQAMYEESPCLEFFIGRQGDATPAVVAIEGEVQTLSEQARFYDRLTFIKDLTNFVGSSSWLVCLVLQDYFSFRKKYGVEALESYFIQLSKHLGGQISNLHYSRYSDESIVLLLTNSDMTKVDRLGMAIVSSAEGFMYDIDGENIHGKFSFAYTNLGDSVASITDACNRLDDLAGLLDNRVVVSDDEVIEETAAKSETASVENVQIEEEYMPLYTAFQNNLVRQTYVPVVDFSMKGKEHYIASFDLHDDAGEVVIWNKSFTYTSGNSLMRTLDLFMMEKAIESLSTTDDSKCILIPLSMYFVDHQHELLEWIASHGKKYFSSKQITIGIAEEAVEDHFDTIKTLFHSLTEAGVSTAVYDIVDITTTKVLELDLEVVALSANCIGRMSRSISSEEMVKLPQLLAGLSQKNASMLATGINSPTSMTLVWEYNIPYACGNMIGAPTLSLDFDFSQMIM